jgi:uncharacterized membrane protein YgcG
MKKMIFFLCLALVSFVVEADGPVINDYDVDITINKNASILVSETINVTTDGDIIKHGIFRDIPTKYKTPQGYNYDVALHLISVQKDGSDEPYHSEEMGNGIRIYVGQAEELLPPGTYTYKLTYSVTRELGFFANHDELYWNATGNGWGFSILKAKATVHLPKNTHILSTTAYTGATGAKGDDFKTTDITPNEVLFTTTAPLPPENGLTIVVNWPKGIIKEPTLDTKIKNFVSDNRPLILAAGGYVFLVVFYLIAWFRLGRDPKTNTVIPLFEPPAEFPPQALGYIKDMGYSNKQFTAAIINMAVNKYLTIEKTEDGDYVLTKISMSNSQLSPSEKVISKELFKDQSELILKQANHEQISEAISEFEASLEQKLRPNYFETHSSIIFLGCIISLLSMIELVINNSNLIFGPVVVLVSMYFIVWAPVANSYLQYRNKKSSGSLIIFLIMAILCTVVFSVSYFIIILFSDEWPICFLVVLFAATNLLFKYLMKQPTQIGGDLISKIKGFELFLRATEQDQINFRNPPDKTPELFEKYLPYALALGLEQAWSMQFVQVFAQMQYSPTWYRGYGYTTFVASDFSQSIGGSLSTAIASSSTAPGSSSGSGGFSGGGGGGGGGGGW